MNQKKPYLISCASRTAGVEIYENSLKNLKGSAELVTVWFEEYPGHLYRFDNLLEKDLDPDRWWIFTDCCDVIFQTPIPDLDETNHEIIVTDEKQIHDGEFWTPFIKQTPVFTPLLRTTAYNVGTQAMRGHLFIKWIKYLQAFRKALKHEHQCLEQLIYNMFIQDHLYEITQHPTFATVLCQNLSRGFVVRNREGLFVNNLDQPYSIVHANGPSKGWLTLI